MAGPWNNLRLTPGERLARRQQERCGPALTGEAAEVRGLLAGTAPAGLDLSGSPMQEVRAEPNRDYADDTDFVYMRGGADFRTRLTPADRVSVIAALIAADGLEELREQARALDAVAWENYPHELAEEAQSLVGAAHAAGYAQAVKDLRATGQDSEAVRKALGDVLAQLKASAEPGASPESWAAAQDMGALARVITLLGGS
jgi:hypothetical protein